MQDGDPQLLALDLRAEGEELEFWDYDLVTQLEDEHTLRVVQRCPVLAALPDQVELEIYSQELFWRVTGDWSLALTVDKSEPAAKSLVAEPKTVISAEGRKVIVDKVVVAPTGGGIVLTEAGDCRLWSILFCGMTKATFCPQSGMARYPAPFCPSPTLLSSTAGGPTWSPLPSSPG